MTKKYDKLGRELKVGDYVAVPMSNSLVFRSVVKLTPKMVAVKSLKGKHVKYVYSNDLVILPEDEMTLYLLKL